MHRRPALRLVVVPVVVIALAVALGSWASGRAVDPRSALTSALDTLPRGTAVAGFTDWSAIRDRSPDEASLRDLTTRSVLAGSIDDMRRAYGWSATDLDWEAYGQSVRGSAMVARLSPHVSIDAVEARLRTLGYSRDGEVWSIDTAGGTEVGPELAATLGNLAIVRGRRLVVATDRAAYLPAVLATIRDRDASLLSVRSAADVATALEGSDTALVQSGPFGCRATSFASADADVRAQAAAATARAGALAMPRVTGRGLVDGRLRQTIRFVAAFASPAQAAAQARVRAALSTGPFIGRSGRVEDVLDLRGATAHGSVATLRFALDPDKGAFMSGEGPLLFAACP